MRRSAVLLSLLWSALALASPASENRGYTSRPCGFDMNRNGVFAEPADCNVCDGTTTDPDGDGNAEDLIYVDCDAGSDQTGDGSPTNPLRTIANAISRANGTGEEDIVCFKGTCNDYNLNLEGMAGKTGTYSVPASGNQVRSFNYPNNPAMIVGWDADNDGQYPPFDTDDTAVLAAVVDAADSLVSAGQDYFEFAHFSVRDYGKNDGIDHGSVGNVAVPLDYNYFHDLELSGINDNTCQTSARIVFNVFFLPVSLAIENVSTVESGAYFMRGTGGGGPEEKGPIRIQNLTLSMRGMVEGSSCGSGNGPTRFIKIWGYFTGIEVLDSLHICDVDNWHGTPDTKPCSGVLAAQCTQDWDIINNEFRDVTEVLICQGYAAGTCDDAIARTVDDIVYDRNLYINTTTGSFMEGARAVSLGTFGNSPGEMCEDITIANSIFHWNDSRWEGAILYHGDYGGAGDVPGTIKIINNTFYGDNKHSPTSSPREGYIVFDPAPANKRHNNIVIKNNIMAGGTEPCFNTYFDYAPPNFDSDNNVFDGSCYYRWVGSTESAIAGWQSDTGGDASSLECHPTFIDSSSDDFHLAADDTCALGRGTDIGADTSWSPECDIDGEIRPIGGGWDAGADETVTELVPSAPENLRPRRGFQRSVDP